MKENLEYFSASVIDTLTQLTKERLKNNNCAGSALATINKKRSVSPSLSTSAQLRADSLGSTTTDNTGTVWLLRGLLGL